MKRKEREYSDEMPFPKRSKYVNPNYRNWLSRALGGRRRGSGFYNYRRRRYSRAFRSGRGTTTQYDRKTIYSKKRMPLGKKRTWSKFVKKVRAVTTSERCGRSIVMNKTLNIGTTGQNFGVFGLLNVNGTDGTKEVGMEDLSLLVTHEPALNAGNSKMLLKSAVLDITMNVPFDNIYAMEIDLYEIMAKRKVPYEGLQAAITTAQAATPTIGASAYYNALDIGSLRGVTPFQIPQLLQDYTIIKKTKYTLNPSQNATFQIRDPKNREYDYKEVTSSTGHADPKMGSKILMAIVKGIDSGINGVQVNFGISRTYYYTYEGCNTYEDGWKQV